MRILLLIRYFDFGGAENHVCELANTLQKAGHTVVLVSRKGRQQQRLHPGIIHYSMGISTKKVPFHFIRLIKIIRRHQIDVVHAHQRLPLTLASALGKISRIPVVGTVHSMFQQDMRKKWVRKGMSKVIVVCRNSFKGAQGDLVLKNKVHCIPNGIHLPESPAKKTPETLRIFYVSRLDAPHTQVVRFLIQEVWPQLVLIYPGAQLTIAGDGTGMPAIRQIIQEINDPATVLSVSTTGYLSAISSEIKNASLVIGVGRVAIESLALGIPVLSMKNNRLGPLLTRENFDFLQYGNFVDVEADTPTTERFLTTIREFVSRQEHYKNEALELRKRIVESNDIRETTEATIRVYEEAINRF
ncbi:MAG: glycosyltransferase [Prolixibacteraceae bacterium]|jgi:glycosyltransferase involved in cell wall biosynthesis|nr:glycosyltransferase [Prolixibacteraceae bacterium]